MTPQQVLYGQIATGQGLFTERQWVWVVKRSEEETHRRLLSEEFRPLGIRYLVKLCFEKMSMSAEWTLMPTEEGLRRRIQELADPRIFEPAPLVHRGDPQHKEEDIDPHNVRAAYGAPFAMQSCYLLNKEWYKRQGIWTWYEIVSEFEERLSIDKVPELG
jgi:hypothetical protein